MGTDASDIQAHKTRPGAPEGLLLRRFAEADRAACQALAARAALSSYGRHLEGARELFTPDTPLEQVDWRLVALADGRIVGFVDVLGRHLANVFVDPDLQGRGIGTALLGHVASRLGPPLTLSCFTVNPGARRLYERLGFAVTGEDVIPFNGRDARIWRMTLDRPIGS